MTEVCSGSIGVNSVQGNPQFINITNKNFKLQSTSPAINTGANLGAPYYIDKDGISRPQGSAWDIGAYETSGGIGMNLGSSNTANVFSAFWSAFGSLFGN
jgi:hypothetical protein